MAGRIHERGNVNENSSKKVGGAVIRKFGSISQFGDFRSTMSSSDASYVSSSGSEAAETEVEYDLQVEGS